MSTPLAVSVGCGGREDGEAAAPPTLAAAADESAGTGGGGVCGEAVVGVVDAGGRAGAELLPRRRFPWDDAPEYGATTIEFHATSSHQSHIINRSLT